MSKHKTPIKFEQADNGAMAISGDCKFFMINNWFEEDKETGFITDKCRLDVMKTIQQKLLDLEFRNVRPEQQSIVILGETIMCFQKSDSKMKKLDEKQCVEASAVVMEAFFKQAMKDGFFDKVDIEKLKATMEPEKDSEEPMDAEG